MIYFILSCVYYFFARNIVQLLYKNIFKQKTCQFYTKVYLLSTLQCNSNLYFYATKSLKLSNNLKENQLISYIVVISSITIYEPSFNSSSLDFNYSGKTNIIFFSFKKFFFVKITGNITCIKFVIIVVHFAHFC